MIDKLKILVGTVLFFMLLGWFFYWRESLTKQEKTEYFDGNPYSGPMRCRVRVDDKFRAFYDNKLVFEGDRWDKVYEFDIDDVRPNTRVYFDCENNYGPGGIIGEFEYGGRKFYTGLDTMYVANRIIETKNGTRYSGDRFMGCFNDRSERDIVRYEGTVPNSSECFKRALLAGKRYYGLQAGNQCFIGNQYGRFGKAEKCQNTRNRQSGEYFGGGWENAVFDTKQSPLTVEVNLGWTGFNPKAKTLWANNDRANGLYTFVLRVPDTAKVDFCPDINYAEFNPAGCTNPLDSAACRASHYPNFNPLQSMCNKPVDYTDYRKIYEQIASAWEIIASPKEKVLSNVRSVTDKVYFGDETKSCANKEWKDKQGDITFFIMDNKVISELQDKKYDANNPALKYSWSFLTANYYLTRLLKPLAEIVNYPLDTTQMTINGDVTPDTPQYYSLIERGIKYSENGSSLVGDRFKKHLKELYDMARIINGNPKQVRECDCLDGAYRNSRNCVPC